MGPNDISSCLLKLALPNVLESLTYLYNLCIEHNSFSLAQNAANVLHYLKPKVSLTLKPLGQYLFSLFLLNRLK